MKKQGMRSLSRCTSALAVAGVLAFTVTQQTAAHCKNDTTATAWQLPPIYVIDENGTSVPQAQVAVVHKSWPVNGFDVQSTNAMGTVILDQQDYRSLRATEPPEGTMEVLALVPSKAPAYAEWTLPTSAPLTIKVEKGKPVDIELSSWDGRPIPDNVVPLVYPKEFAAVFHPKMARAILPEWPEPLTAGKSRIYLGETSAPLYLEVNQPDFLVGYIKDFSTTEALQTGKVQMKLPKPGTVNIEIATADNITSDKVELDFAAGRFSVELNERVGTSVHILEKSITLPRGKSTRFTIHNVAPKVRQYDRARFSLRDPAADKLQWPYKIPPYSEAHAFELAPGETTSVQFLYREFSPDLMKGNGTATFHFKRHDGSPAAGIKVHLMASHRDFSGWFTVVKGPVDDNGTTVIEHLATDTTYILHKAWGDTENISGYINFEDGATSISKSFTLELSESDPAPEVTFTDLATSQPVKLSDFRGKVVFLDFWATWCGPCQRPMAHNQSVMEKNAKRWGDRAIILAASVDAEPDVVLPHVKKKGWESMTHVWCGDKASSGTADKIYGVGGIPSAFLINLEGKIVWHGHPEGFDVAREIDKLLSEPIREKRNL